MPFFWHSNWHYFGYTVVKVAKPHFLESPQKSIKTHEHLYQYCHPLRNNDPLKIWKIFVCFDGSFFQKNYCWHLEFLMNQIFGQSLSYWEKWGVGVNYCWNHGPSKLLLDFIEYRPDQLNNKHTKITINSTIPYFEGCSRKKCLLKVWRFLDHPPQNEGPVKFLRN